MGSRCRPIRPRGRHRRGQKNRPRKSKMAVELVLDPSFGYALLVVVAAGVLNIWMSGKVASKRQEIGLKYPAMYSDKNQDYNCYQRAHQNTLENQPLFLATLTAAALNQPKLAAAAGAAWVVGRFIYANGYFTGNPERRVPGFMISFLAQIVLYYGVVSSAGSLIGWW